MEKLRKSTKNAETPDNSLNYYFCPRCKGAPLIEYKKNGNVKIHCKCNKGTTFQNIVDNVEDGEEPRTLDELCDYKYYEISQKRFIEEINKISKEPPECCMKENHRSAKGEIFCTECHKWYCAKCISAHERTYLGHLSYKSKGMELNSLCENEECKLKERCTFYCKNCNMNLCSECQKTHNDSHKMFGIKETYSDADIEKIISNILLFHKNYDEEMQTYDQYLKDLYQERQKNAKMPREHKIPDKTVKLYYESLAGRYSYCRELLGNKILENNIMKIFSQSLINAYRTTKKIPNYNLKNNLVLHQKHIENILQYKRQTFVDRITNQLGSFSILKFSSPSYLIAEYNIKDDLEVKNDNSNRYKILGDDYEELSDENCIMSIDGNDVSYTKQFKEGTKGKHTVKIQMRLGLPIVDMDGMFHSCWNLCGIDLSHLDTSQVVSMDGMFSYCNSLTDINFTHIDISQVTSMDEMFSRCKKLTSIDLKGLDTSQVTSMDEMFSDCIKLTEVNLSDLKTDKLTSMKDMFSGCESLRKLNLPKINTSKVNIEGIITGCTSLASFEY